MQYNLTGTHYCAALGAPALRWIARNSTIYCLCRYLSCSLLIARTISRATGIGTA